MSNFNYKSNDFDKEAQRFITPLYIRDELGNYEYSSTGTFITYNESHYIVFAAHALDNHDNIKNVFIPLSDGTFLGIDEISIGHEIFEEDDLVIIDCFNRIIGNKNYFLLEELEGLEGLEGLEKKLEYNGFDKKRFEWRGFPSSWVNSKIIHNTKKLSSIKEAAIVQTENGTFNKSARYFGIKSEIETFNKKEITGTYKKKVDYKYNKEHKQSPGPSPEGMSGGPMFCFSENEDLKDDLNSTFLLVGIGLRFNKRTRKITGISRIRLIELFEKFEKNNPL